MTLDEFFKECKQKGATPLSYKEFTESINGTKTVEYENPAYRKAKEVIGRVLKRGRGNGNSNSGIDGLVSNLYGENVAIRTRDGYHHGKAFMLGNYLFNGRPMEMMDYETEFFYGEDTIIPAKDIIEIPTVGGLFKLLRKYKQWVSWIKGKNKILYWLAKLFFPVLLVIVIVAIIVAVYKFCSPIYPSLEKWYGMIVPWLKKLYLFISKVIYDFIFVR